MISYDFSHTKVHQLRLCISRLWYWLYQYMPCWLLMTSRACYTRDVPWRYMGMPLCRCSFYGLMSIRVVYYIFSMSLTVFSIVSYMRLCDAQSASPHCIDVCLLCGGSYNINSGYICVFDVRSTIYIIFGWVVNSSAKRGLICCTTDTSQHIYNISRVGLLATTPGAPYSDTQFSFVILYVCIWLRLHCYTTAIAGNEWLRWVIIH